MTMKSGKKIFRPRARIIKSLGDELISNEFVAISELVKNSYDAGAGFVKIDVHKDKLVIVDNGKGMTLTDLQTGWFEPATNIKVKNKKLLGEKGIGRFSVVKLASNLELQTKSNGHNAIASSFNWEDFNKENSYLDEVEIEWKEIEWNGETETGTVLMLTGLKNDWSSTNRINELKIFLARMVSPFGEAENFHIKLRTEGSEIYEKIETSEILKHPNYCANGSVISGQMEISYSGLGSRKKTIKKNLDEILFPCGDFEFEFRVWDRDLENIKELSSEFDMLPNDFKTILDYSAGISVYRDGFRVLPYGEVHNDWLRLDMRRVQNPSLRLSNNQVIGYVKISKENNPELKDKTNREGLIENIQYEDFYNKIRDFAIKAIEEERFLDRKPKREEITASRNVSQNLDRNISLEEVENYAETTYPSDKKLSEKISKAKQETREQGEKFKKLILRYRRLSTLGQLLETVIHEINNSFAKVSAQLSIIKNYAGEAEKVLQKVDEVKNLQELLQKFIERLKPFAERNAERSSQLSIKKEIENVIVIEKALLESNKISVSLPTEDAKILIKKVDIFSIFSNLLSNSVYWLQEIEEEKGRKIAINIKEDDSNISIFFSDNGPGIEEEFKPYIFDPYFSRKKDGTGLGLSIVGEIVSDYGGDLEYYEDGDLGGAAFKITFKK